MLNLLLWNNNFFQYQDSTFYCNKNWIASNTLYVKDLIKENGDFESLQTLSYILIKCLCEY